MRVAKRLLFGACAAALAGGASLARAQSSSAASEARPSRDVLLPSIPKDLEEMLARAFRSNPEIQLAEAKLRGVEAELNQVRLRITEEVMGLFNDQKLKRQRLQRLQVALGQVHQRLAAGLSSSDEVAASEIAVIEAEADQTRLEAKLRYALGLVGKRPAAGSDASSGAPESADPGAGGGTQNSLSRAAVRTPEIPPDIRQALDTVVKADFKQVPFREVVATLSEAAGLPFVIDKQSWSEDYLEAPISLELPGKHTIRTVLQAFADQELMEFVFRDYGVFVTLRAGAFPDAPRIPSASVERDR